MRAADKGQAVPLQDAPLRQIGPFARHQEQTQIGMDVGSPFKYVQDNFLFGRWVLPAIQTRSPACTPKSLRNSRVRGLSRSVLAPSYFTEPVTWTLLAPRASKLRAYSSVSRQPDRACPKRAAQGAEFLVTHKAAWTHAAIGYRHANANMLGGTQKIWPQLALGQHDDIRPNSPQGPFDRPGKVQRPPENGTAGKALFSLRETSFGGCRDDAVAMQVPLAKGGNDVFQKVYFTDADAMEPDAGRIAVPPKGTAGEFFPHAPAVLLIGQCFEGQPRGENAQGQQVNEIQEVGHASPFRNTADVSPRIKCYSNGISLAHTAANSNWR